MVGQPSPRLPAILMLLLSMLLVAAQPGEASPEQGSRAPGKPGWKGTREVRDGVIYVSNPAEPLEGTVEYELRDLWRLESETAAGELVFGVIQDVAEDADGNVYLLDSQLKTVHVVSPEGRYLRSIGRAGEGPGEFTNPVQVLFSADGRLCVVDLEASSATYFALDGTPLASWKASLAAFPDSWIVTLSLLPSGEWAARIRARSRSESEMRTIDIVGILGANGELKSEAVHKEHVRLRGEPFTYEEEATDEVQLLGCTAAGDVLISEDYTNLGFNIYGADARLRARITRQGHAVSRSPERISELEAYWRKYFEQRRNLQLKISPYERSVVGACVRDDSTLWIRSAQGVFKLPPGCAEIIDVFGPDGTFLRNAMLRHAFSEKEDILFPLRHRVVIVEKGLSATFGAAGVGTQRASDTGTQPPSVVCCTVDQKSRDH